MEDTQATTEAAQNHDELAELERELYAGDAAAAPAAAEGEGEDAHADTRVVGSENASGKAGASSTAAEQAPAQPMSKNQMKKLAKLERQAVQKAAWKEAEKAAKAAKAAERAAERQQQLAGMSAEERQERQEQTQARKKAMYDEKHAMLAKMAKALAEGQRVVIDLDFEGLMSESDARHLVQQLSFAYAANKAVSNPLHLQLTSLHGPMKERATKQIAGLENWHVTHSALPYHQLHKDNPSCLVYLSADAEVELTDLDSSKVYIIGGLVDHNKHKGLCARRARELGIATARLPIKQHVALASSAVLTVNHVVQLLAEYVSNGRDWAAAIDHVIPARKREGYVKGQGKDASPAPAGKQRQGADLSTALEAPVASAPAASAPAPAAAEGVSGADGGDAWAGADAAAVEAVGAEADAVEADTAAPGQMAGSKRKAENEPDCGREQ